MNSAAIRQQSNDRLAHGRCRRRHSFRRGKKSAPAKAGCFKSGESGAQTRPEEARIAVARILDPVFAAPS
jgi:hypothetical protein